MKIDKNMTVKQLLSEIKCQKCGNEKADNFILYFVKENKNSPTQKYIKCLNPECEALFELTDECFKKIKDYLLEPDINKGG